MADAVGQDTAPPDVAPVDAAPSDAAPGDTRVGHQPSDPPWDHWENAAHPAPAAPELHVAGFDGPLDLLLDLVERARIDLRTISIVTLVEQCAQALTRFADTAPIERRADWLVLTARLLELRSRLLFTADPAAQAEAAAEARREFRRLLDLQLVRAAAAWLEARPQLGRDVFGRPRRGPDPRVASYMTLMEACLAVLEREEAQEMLSSGSAIAAIYRPATPTLFRIQDAIARLRAKLVGITEPRPLADFVQKVPKEAPNRELLARSALGCTFVAALETARLGEVRLEQKSPMSAIGVTRV